MQVCNLILYIGRTINKINIYIHFSDYALTASNDFIANCLPNLNNIENNDKENIGPIVNQEGN